ncbi:GTP-binding protein [Grosmannia clavigera kw1407]|uniref:GTP-binding protein n=1 Tax=Grosmannia clavigera (strain kw1407 / UAMH 11150) TaxID=655863 RepID=F0XJD3_GROCL|nr:GTP-binding protein [Grosmannia clavigera kw1407]EFX02326.1 GTP-binding protein [Grosmannia clavigera kw1407]
MTPADIRLLFSTAGETVLDQGSGRYVLTETEKTRRISSLQQALASVQHLWLSGSTDLDTAVEILADGSRDATWRKPIGESGILAFFLGIICEAGLRTSLKMHTLRLIGNSCADEDSNRARVVAGNHLHQLVPLLFDDTLLAFAIPVMFNICVDYEPAQVQASQAGISHALLDILSEPDAPLVDIDTPVRLLQLEASPDVILDAEEFQTLISIVLACLSHETFQAELNRRGGVELLLKAFSDSYIKFSEADLNAEDAEDFVLVRNQFTAIIADVMADSSFFTVYSVASPVIQTLEHWLRDDSTNTALRTAACYALGNLARSDDTSTYFVHTDEVHTSLISLLTTQSTSSNQPPPTQLYYAALSCLKNLAIPLSNKPKLGIMLEPTVSLLPRFWANSTQPHLQFAAISLTRLLLASCPDNVRRICIPLSTDPSSPAHERSNLHVLADIFNRIDAENAKTEAARVIATVCRVLHATPGQPPVLSDDWEPSIEAGTTVAASFSMPSLTTAGAATLIEPDLSLVPATATPSHLEQSRRARFYAAQLDMADALSYLMTQSRYPVLRSETIFICALMSCSTDGARLVMRALQPFDVCRVLVEAVSGKDMVDGHELQMGQKPAGQASDSGATVPSETLLLQELLSSTEGTNDASLIPLPTAAEHGSESGGPTPQPVNPAQAAQASRLDLENGIVLLSEIMKNFSQFLPPPRRSMFEQTLQIGATRLSQAKEEQAKIH